MRLKIAIAMTGACLLSAPQEPTTAAAILGELDYSVILSTWMIKGAMACPDPCLWVENAFPSGILEVVRQEWRTDLAEFRPGLQALRFALPDSTGSHGDDEDGSGSTLQFAEARVFEFVPPLDIGLLAKPDGAPAALDFVSELDYWGWRIPELDALTHPAEIAILCEGARLPLAACAGAWGNYYPRSGFVIRDSEVMAALLQALRAGRAASDPALRVVLRRYPFEPRTGHYIQMLSPVRRAAIRIGQDPVEGVEKGAGARDGAYRFAHFGIFEACRGCLPTRLVEARRP